VFRVSLTVSLDDVASKHSSRSHFNKLWQNEEMDGKIITRRSLLLSGAVLAASSATDAFPGATSPISAAEVIARIKTKVGIPWQTETVDKFVAGDPNLTVKGVAVTGMATLEVLQRASAVDHNLIISHEPTFYSHYDDIPEALSSDATYRLKANYVRDHSALQHDYLDRAATVIAEMAHHPKLRD
jgi:hypothetical protein